MEKMVWHSTKLLDSDWSRAVRANNSLLLWQRRVSAAILGKFEGKHEVNLMVFTFQFEI